jgi:hypothetical protein
VRSISKQTAMRYGLPEGCLGIDQIGLLQDSLLLGFIAQGRFYLVDLSKESENLKVQCCIGLNAYPIIQFTVDGSMQKLILTADKCYLYDLCKTIENFRASAEKTNFSLTLPKTQSEPVLSPEHSQV